MKSNKTRYKNPANSTVHNIKISTPTQRLHIAKYCSHDCTRLPHAHSFAFSAQLRDGRRNFPQLIIGHPDAVSARFTQRQHDHHLLALAVLGICSEGPDALKMIFVCPAGRFAHGSARSAPVAGAEAGELEKRTLRSLWRTRSQGQPCPCLPGAMSKYQPMPARRGPTAAALCSAESSPGRTVRRKNLHPRQRNRLHRLRQHANAHLNGWAWQAGAKAPALTRLASRRIALQTRDVRWNEDHQCANGGRTRQPFGAAHRPNGCGGLPEGASPSPAVSSLVRLFLPH